MMDASARVRAFIRARPLTASELLGKVRLVCFSKRLALSDPPSALADYVLTRAWSAATAEAF